MRSRTLKLWVLGLVSVLVFLALWDKSLRIQRRSDVMIYHHGVISGSGVITGEGGTRSGSDVTKRHNDTASLRATVPSEHRYYRMRETKVNPLNYQVLSSEESLCETWDDVTPSHPRILILVLSDPSHQGERTAIRNTWASHHFPHNSTSTKVMFVVGDSGDDVIRETVRQEHDYNHDVLQVDVTDTYQTITAKVLTALDWASRFCTSADYFFKTDDDIYVNVQSLVRTISAFKRTNIIFGVDIGYAPVHRKGKWQLSVEQYPFDTLPLYLSGCGYGMSVDAAQQLVRTSEYVPQLPVEDVYVTGILPRIGNVSVHPSHAFPTWQSQTSSDACLVLSGRMVALHGVDVKRMYATWWTARNNSTWHCSAS